MLRHVLVFTAALIALSALPVASSAQEPFPGSWHTEAIVNGMNCTFDRVLTVTGTFRETVHCGSLIMGQSGTYQVFPNHTVLFVVTNWSPTRRYVRDNNGSGGHYELNLKPPSSTYAYTFAGPNTLTFRHVVYGNAATFRRVR
jgi:hypothetical protein